jgi:alpha-1,6-mannosyltransferase
MRILDLAEFYSERGGGVRSYLDKLLAAARRRGHRVTVVAPGPRDETREEGGAKIVRYAAPRMPYDGTYHWPWRVDRMRAIVRAERPDVLQVSTPFVPALVAATLRDVPVKAYVHHADPIGAYLAPLIARLPERAGAVAEKPAWAALRAVCNRFDVTVVAGHWLERELQQRGCQRVRTVPFGIAHADFGPDRRDASLRAELLGPLAGDPSAKLLIVAGRLAVEKRQALVIDAVRALARTRKVALVVLGDGPERARLEKRAEGLVTRWLPFTRDRAEYAALLASADVLVHGSACETFGFVLGEALASGTPIVVPDAGGAAPMVAGAGATYAPWDATPEEIAEAIGSVLDRPRDELTAAALAAARRHPTTEEHFDALFGLYASMLRGTPRGVRRVAENHAP